MSAVLVCFALPEEAKFFWSKLESLPHTRSLITGMGWANAERSVRGALEERRPNFVVTSGFAGGLAPQLRLGDIVFCAGAESRWEEALTSLGAKRAKFLCAKTVAATAAEKRRLRGETGADAVEMESEVITRVCEEYAIPCTTMRVVLDTAEEDLPLNFNELMTPEMKMHNGKLALAIAAAPWKIPELLRLQKRGHAAARRLAEVLEQVLKV